MEVLIAKNIKERNRSAFTLIELIVALAVLSIAITVVVQMFSMSVDMARNAQNAILAHMVAEEKLGVLINHPENFIWKIPQDYKFGDFFRVLSSSDEPETGNKVEDFSLLPPDWGQYQKYKNALSTFRWKVLGKLPSPDSDVFEVSVVVSYKELGRTKYYVLTSYVPKGKTASRS